jgi:threonine dehydratase
VVHPYNDWRIIAGQSTCAKELIEQVNDLDMIIAPVGGGGLLSGTALSAKYFGNRIRVLGAEPRNADDAYRSLISGVRQESIDPRTVADGLLTSLGELTFSVIKQHVEAILTVTEENIVAGMRHLWERLKQVVEPSGAVPFAALLEHREEIAGRRIGVILSGGNVDLENLPWQTPRQPI